MSAGRKPEPPTQVKDKKLLVELFQECGEKELKYVIRSGLSSLLLSSRYKSL